jgi:Transcriptional repressor TCF25
MSGKRLNKRQLREQQELEALGQSSKAEVPLEQESKVEENTNDDAELEEEKEEDIPIPPTTGAGIFAQLGEAGDVDDEDSNDEGQDDITVNAKKSKSKNKKKKKKKPAAVKLEGEGENVDSDKTKEETTPEPSIPSKTNSKKKTKKPSSSTTATKSKKEVSDMSMDEFSALLASQTELNEKDANGSDPIATVTPAGPLSSLRSHLSLSAPALDPAVELKRQFGAAAIKAYENEAGGGQGGAASSGARARAQAYNTNFKVRNLLVQPKDTWPPIARTFTGMTMEVFDVEGRGKIGGWVHSRAYREAQYQFLQAVQSYEPNHLMGLLRMYPWHIDTLLQLSDVSRHQGDLGQASDFNSRALFAFERTSAPIFTSSLTSHLGPPMLNFARIEDRGFWLASHRNVNFLGRRGTWRTALEWVKLILGLDPTSDHHGMLLWLDFLSIKSKQQSWFLDCLQRLEAAAAKEMEENSVPILNAKTPFDTTDKGIVGEAEGCRGALDWYLGLAYAKALALRAEEKDKGGEEKANATKSTAALRLAISRHPQLLPSLLDKIGVSMPEGVPRSHPIFEFPTAEGDSMPELLTHVYVSRSESLWREAGMSTWLTKTIKEVWPTLEKSFESNQWNRACVTYEKARLSIYRHVLVSDLPDTLRQTLIGLMPKEITSDSSKLNAFDPLPPQGEGTTSYDDDYFATMRSRRNVAGMDGEEMDGPAAAGMMDRLMQALRGVRGLEGWGAAMEQMDDESRQDVMAQIMEMAAQGQNAREGGMPGGLEGLDDLEEQEGEGINQAGPGTFNALRGFLDRMWGTQPQPESEEEDLNEEGESE